MRIFFAIILFSISSLGIANPKCDGKNNWAAAMAHAHLKNAGIIENNKINFDLTEVTRLASEKIDDDLFHQIHLVAYVKKTGERIEVITTNNASSQECSMGRVKVYVINGTIGG